MNAAAPGRRRPRPAPAEQLREDNAQLRTELEETRAALRAAASLAISIGVHRAPQGVGGGPRNVLGICQMYGLGPHHAAALDKLFEPGT